MTSRQPLRETNCRMLRSDPNVTPMCVGGGTLTSGTGSICSSNWWHADKGQSDVSLESFAANCSKSIGGGGTGAADNATAGRSRAWLPRFGSSPARKGLLATAARPLAPRTTFAVQVASRNLPTNRFQCSTKPCRAASSANSARVTAFASSKARIRRWSLARPTLRAMIAR